MMMSLGSKAVVNLRDFSEILEDARLEVMLLASIACVTKEKNDIRRTVSAAKEHGLHTDYSGKSLAIIVRTLARMPDRIPEAREVALHMKGISTFWHTEALISIIEFSGEKKDEQEARESILRIRAMHLRRDAKHDLDLALANHRSGKKESFVADLTELGHVLNQLEDFEDGHILTPKVNNAHLRLLAQEIIDRIFAKAMK